MSAGPHPALADPAAWASAAAELLAELGFSLVNGDDPTEPGGANLLVALRPRPTLVHFDPEVVRFWRFDGRRGSQAELTRTSRPPAVAAFSWGRIEVVDRLLVENQFIGFGGELRVADTPDGTRLVHFHSPAPILRWAGHSQGVDAMTDEVGAFFAGSWRRSTSRRVPRRSSGKPDRPPSTPPSSRTPGGASPRPRISARPSPSSRPGPGARATGSSATCQRPTRPAGRSGSRSGCAPPADHPPSGDARRPAGRSATPGLVGGAFGDDAR
jgi:hypothetical protein